MVQDESLQGWLVERRWERRERGRQSVLEERKRIDLIDVLDFGARRSKKIGPPIALYGMLSAAAKINIVHFIQVSIIFIDPRWRLDRHGKAMTRRRAPSLAERRPELGVGGFRAETTQTSRCLGWRLYRIESALTQPLAIRSDGAVRRLEEARRLSPQAMVAA